MGNYTTNPSILLQSNILKKRGDDKYDCIIKKDNHVPKYIITIE